MCCEPRRFWPCAPRVSRAALLFAFAREQLERAARRALHPGSVRAGTNERASAWSPYGASFARTTGGLPGQLGKSSCSHTCDNVTDQSGAVCRALQSRRPALACRRISDPAFHQEKVRRRARDRERDRPAPARSGNPIIPGAERRHHGHSSRFDAEKIPGPRGYSIASAASLSASSSRPSTPSLLVSSVTDTQCPGVGRTIMLKDV